jgi:hypothetical protein
MKFTWHITVQKHGISQKFFNCSGNNTNRYKGSKAIPVTGRGSP